MSKNSLLPWNGSATSAPGIRRRTPGAWSWRASSTPEAGIGEFTPVPTLSPSRTSCATSTAIKSSASYIPHGLQVIHRRPAGALVRGQGHHVDKARRHNLLVLVEAAGGVFGYLLGGRDDRGRALHQQAIVISRANDEVALVVRTSRVDQREVRSQSGDKNNRATARIQL